MAVQVQHRRGTAAANTTFIGAEGELIWLTDEKRWVGHDGATPGGVKTARFDEVTAEVMRAVGNADFSFQVTDRLVVPNAVFTAPRIAALPAASSVAAGRTISFFDALPALNGANVLTVGRSGSDTINGATSFACALPRGRWEFVSDGISKWSVAGLSASGIAFVPSGNIAATNVQAAISELDSEKANDNAVVKLTGDQTIAGTKTFSAPITGSITGDAATVFGYAQGDFDFRYVGDIRLGTATVIAADTATAPGYNRWKAPAGSVLVDIFQSTASHLIDFPAARPIQKFSHFAGVWVTVSEI